MLAVSTTALAFPSARLIYVRGQGAEECPSEMELRLSVAHRLGYDPFNTGSRRTIMAVVERSGERLTARMELVNEQGVSQGERRLEAPPDGCADLIRALALSMSIAIDPERTENASSETPLVFGVPAASAPPPGRKDTTASSGVQTETTGRPLILRFGFGGQAALGVAPAPVAGLLVVGAPRYQNFSLSFEFRTDATASRTLENGTTIESRLMAGSFAPCFHLDPGYACAVGTLGAVEATSDAPKREEDSGLYGGLGFRLGTEWPVAKFLVLRTHADLLATLTPVDIRLDKQSVWEMSPITGSLGVALLGSFP